MYTYIKYMYTYIYIYICILYTIYICYKLKRNMAIAKNKRVLL